MAAGRCAHDHGFVFLVDNMFSKWLLLALTILTKKTWKSKGRTFTYCKGARCRGNPI